MECKHLENQICIRTDGQYRLCCVSNESNNLENIRTHSPEQWLKSKTVNDAKLKLANNVWPDACKKCEIQEQNNLPSKRLNNNDLGPGISHLDLRFSNSCNLGCVMCFPGSSSTILYEHEKLKKLNIDSPWGDQFFELQNWYDVNNIEKLVNNKELKEIYLTGGEPMMVKHLSDFLKCLKKHIKLRFNTNGTIINPQVLTELAEFEVVEICVSIDGIGKVNDYIRWGSDWNSIEKNIETLSKMSNIKLSIGPTIQILNSYYYNILINYARERNLEIHENILITPAHYCIRNADNKIKEMIPHLKNYHDVTADHNERKKFIRYTKILDETRGCSIKNYLPEVAEIYGFD